MQKKYDKKNVRRRKKEKTDNCVRRIKIGHQNGEHGGQKRKRKLSIRNKLRQKDGIY